MTFLPFSQRLQAFIQDTIQMQINSILFLQQACSSFLEHEDPANTLSP
jgi:hypothetical protein